MKHNSLTLSQAHKLYTGNSMGTSAMILSLFGILSYLASLLFIFLTSWISRGNAAEAMQELNGTTVVNILLAVDSGIILMITGLINYDKQYPGGKYFRSVTGGFETYRKLKSASLITRIAALSAVMIFGALTDILGIIRFTNGMSDCFYIGAFLLVSVALVNFMGLIKNPAVRGFLTPFVVFAAGVFGVMLPRVFDGNIVTALVLAAAAIPLIIICGTHGKKGIPFISVVQIIAYSAFLLFPVSLKAASRLQSVLQAVLGFSLITAVIIALSGYALAVIVTLAIENYWWKKGDKFFMPNRIMINAIGGLEHE